jgi:transposase-like protein
MWCHIFQRAYSIQSQYRQRLQRAYSKETYEGAKKSLQSIKTELKLINESAVRSLEEGFEETLTIHRLGMHEELKRSFKTTNIIESVMAVVGQKTGKIDYCKNSNQKHRWVASSLFYIEQRLNRVNGYKYLPMLKNVSHTKRDWNYRGEGCGGCLMQHRGRY